MQTLRPSIPTTALLLSRFRNAGKMALGLLAIELLILVGLIPSFNWTYLADNRLMVILVVAVASYDLLSDYAMIVAQKKKRVEDLSDGVKIGLYTKAQLLDLIAVIQNRLGLRRHPINVFLLRDKSANASAVRVTFSGLLRSLNAVYINRAILHILQPKELQAVLAHELAHNLPFRMVLRKYGLVHQITIIAIGLSILQLVGATAHLVLPAILLFIFAFRWVVHFFETRYASTIEYLCDYFAARVVGTIPTINALLKIGTLSETHLRLQMQMILENKSRGRLSPQEILKIYENALPFGQVDSEALLDRVETLKRLSIKENSKISVKGFLKYISDTDPDTEDESMDELNRTFQHLHKRPKIDWTRDYLGVSSSSLSGRRIADLVSTMTDHPEAVLFRLPEEIMEQTSHPSFRNRILYLWHNRNLEESV